MEIFADALLIVLMILMLIAFMLMAIFTRANLGDRVKKGRQIAAIINGRSYKSLWQFNSQKTPNVVIKGTWQNYRVGLSLEPYSFRLYIFFPKLKKRGWWFIGFPQMIEQNIVWENQYLYKILKYDDFFNQEGILAQEKLIITFKELEKLAEQLLNISQPQPRL